MAKLIYLESVKSILHRICELCGEDKKYNGTMCSCCVMDGLEDEIDELPTKEST